MPQRHSVGIGSQKVGSRWVPPGLLAVYTSEHAATTVLENLVHMDPIHFGNRYVLIGADISDEARTESVDMASLPYEWQELYDEPVLQQIGEDWIRRMETAFLIVPSPVVPQERNIIINPLHPDFHAIVFHPQHPFRFDVGSIPPAIRMPIRPHDVTVKHTGTGISPMRWDEMVGRDGGARCPAGLWCRQTD